MMTMRRIFLFLLLLPSLLLASGKQKMTITAHAGAYVTPDNTMLSVRTALALHPDLIEIDVRHRPDGSLAISHDEIKSNSDGEDLALVFEAVAKTKIGINLDIKQIETLPKLYELLKKYKLTKQVYMTGVGDKDWEIARRDCPGIPYFTNLAPDTLQLGDASYCERLISRLRETGSMGINCNYGNANAALSELLHKNGFQLSVWTVTEPKDIARIVGINPDNITSRRPDRVEQMSGTHRIGKGKPFFFMQMADPQLGFNKDGSSSIEHSLQQLERSIDVINRLKPAFVINTGDIVHDLLNDANADKYNECMARLNKKIKVYTVPGNHDIRELTPQYFDFYKRHYGEDRFSFKYKGCAFIGFNSTIVQLGESQLEKEQFAWLEKELKKANKCRSIFLFAHIPLICKDMDETDDYHNFPQSLRMKYVELFRKYGAKTMLCGHLHHNLTSQANGVQVFAASAVGYPFDGNDGMPLVKFGKDSFDYRFVGLDEYEGMEKVK